MKPSDEYIKMTGRIWLYNIVAIKNVASIMQLGILSHNQARQVLHDDISLQEVQDIRANVVVDADGERPLHDYANLYFNARNPMMYRRSCYDGRSTELCVLHVSCRVLDLPDTVVSDFNAAKTSLARFMSPSEAIATLPFNEVFARYWNHENQELKRRHSARECAEVLVYNRVGTEFLRGVSVCNPAIAQRAEIADCGLPVHVDGDMFFLQG